MMIARINRYLMLLFFSLLFTACSDADTSMPGELSDSEQKKTGAKYSFVNPIISLKSSQSICAYIHGKFESGTLKSILQKKNFVRNGVFEVFIPTHIRDLQARKIIIQSVEGTLNNAYLELESGKKASGTIELMNTINVVASKKDVFVLTNISTKRIRKDAAIYQIRNSNFLLKCKM